MKQLLTILSLCALFLFPTNSFAATCTGLSATRAGNQIKIQVKTCPTGTYYFTASVGSQKTADKKQKSATYTGDNVGEFNATMPANYLDQTTSATPITASIATGATVPLIDIKTTPFTHISLFQGDTLIQEVRIFDEITFRTLNISQQNNSKEVTITGGIFVSDVAGYRYFIQVTDNRERYNTPNADIPTYYDLTRNLAKDGSITKKIQEPFKNPGQTYYVRQVAYGPNGRKEDTSIYEADATYGSDIVQRTKDLETNSYTLLSTLGGSKDKRITVYDIGSKICKDKEGLCDFSSMLNFVIRLLIGIAVVFLVLRIMYEGFKYMTTDIPGVKLNSKTSIFEMAIGLLIALGSWVILNTINPTLVNNTVTIDKVVIEYEKPKTYISSAEYQKITGKPIRAKKELLALVEKISKEENIDACFVKATITHESDWKSNTLGCDEDVAAKGVPSRRAFISSGIRYDGTALPESSQITDKAIRNNACTVKNNTPGYGLDWRFSKGIGLMQLTLFPESYFDSSYKNNVKKDGVLWNKKNIPAIGIGDNKKYNLKSIGEFFDDEKNIRQGIKEMKKNGAACQNDPEKFLKAFNGGNCNSQNDFAIKQGRARKATYDLCKSGK